LNNNNNNNTEKMQENDVKISTINIEVKEKSIKANSKE